MTTIEVTRADDAGRRFSVTVTHEGSSTSHEVAVLDGDWERYGPGYATRAELVEASFAFLLDREPKESILRSFELGVIARYFPEYPTEIRQRAPS